MASNPSAAVNVRSFGREWELTEEDGSITFVEAVVAVSPLKMSAALRVPIVTNRRQGAVGITHLPMESDPQGTTLVQLADVILDQPFPDQRLRDHLE